MKKSSTSGSSESRRTSKRSDKREPTILNVTGMKKRPAVVGARPVANQNVSKVRPQAERAVSRGAVVVQGENVFIAGTEVAGAPSPVPSWYKSFLSYYSKSAKPTLLEIAKGTIGGVRAEAMLRMQGKWALFSAEEMGTVVGLSARTIARYRAAPNKTLDPAQADRVYRLARIQALAENVLESQEGAYSWLRRAQPGLGGEVPLELLATEAGAREIELLLNRIEYSVGA